MTSDELGQAICAHIVENGPITFEEYVQHALYTPGLGFYARGGGAGRRRDFITSPEVGPLFGALIARALDSWWVEMGSPAHFHLIEAGAGPGTLARALLAAGPRCGRAMEVMLVEPGEVQWATHPAGVTSRAALPAPGELHGAPVVVLANELLDNLPFGVVEFTGVGWSEVLVGVDPATGALTEELRPLDPQRSKWCGDRAGAHIGEGARMPVMSHASAWLSEAMDLVVAGRAGRVLAIDYGSTSEAMAHRSTSEWLRTYAGHDRGLNPLDSPGAYDITCDIALDQLALVHPPSADRSQAEFLHAHGIDDLVMEGRARWDADRWSGGLEALAGLSREAEAAALTDLTGLGAFRALEWIVPDPA